MTAALLMDEYGAVVDVVELESPVVDGEIVVAADEDDESVMT